MSKYNAVCVHTIVVSAYICHNNFLQYDPILTNEESALKATQGYRSELQLT